MNTDMQKTTEYQYVKDNLISIYIKKEERGVFVCCELVYLQAAGIARR